MASKRMDELVGRPALYRSFGGKRYTLQGSAWNKADAKKGAERQRQAGYLARVVRHPEAGYLIYTRRA